MHSGGTFQFGGGMQFGGKFESNQSNRAVLCFKCKKELNYFFVDGKKYYCPQCAYDILAKDISINLKLQKAIIPILYIILFVAYADGSSHLPFSIMLGNFLFGPLIMGPIFIFCIRILYKRNLKLITKAKSILEDQNKKLIDNTEHQEIKIF